MNTATFDSSRAAAARVHLALLAGLLALLKRVAAISAPPRSAVRELDAGANLWIDRPLGRTITCEAGTLWLTFDNEPQDVILEARQSHRCATGSKLLIHALASARLSMA
jgi:hypothetical protein